MTTFQDELNSFINAQGMHENLITVEKNLPYYSQILANLIEHNGSVDINWFINENCIRYDSIQQLQNIILPYCNVLDFILTPNHVHCLRFSNRESYYADFISYGAKHNAIDLNDIDLERYYVFDARLFINALTMHGFSSLPLFKNERFAFDAFRYFEADYKPMIEQYYSYIRKSYLNFLKEHPEEFSRDLRLFHKVDSILTEYQKAYNNSDFSTFNKFEILLINGKLPESDEEFLKLSGEQSNFNASPVMFSLIFGDYDSAYRLFNNQILEKEEIQDILYILLCKIWKRENIEFTSDVLLFIKKHNISLDEDVLEEILELQRPYITDKLPEIKYFFKDAIGDLNYFSHNNLLPEEKINQINIALSNGNSEWSNGLLSAFRYFENKYKNVNIYMINQDILDRLEGEVLDKFYKQFDGWASPGSGDTYPLNETIISLENWQPQNGVDKVYASAIQASSNYSFPYLGICLGTQHLTLHSGGDVQREGLSGLQTIHFIEGTLGYFNAFSLEEKFTMLKTCIMPELTINGDCAHSYSAVSSSLNDAGLTQAAYSENKNLAMSYTNGIKTGMQFHPEHKHLSDEYSFNLLNSFFIQAHLHNLHRNYGAELHPSEFMELIEERLEQCLHAPTTLIEEDISYALFEEFYYNASILEA